jgi:CheY-like chemotaxis protein
MITISKELAKSILIVEDNDQRIAWFKEKFIGVPTVYYVKFAHEAIELVKSKKFDIMFFDHDLGDRVYVDSDDPNTGYKVMLSVPDSMNKDTPIIIHSLNVVGANNMLHIRPDSTWYVPFFNLQLELEII